MRAIYKRELKSYFTSPMGFLFVGLFIYFCATNFIDGPILRQLADPFYTFRAANMLFVFLIPILTMRTFSEERAKKTDQLLICSPVSITKIVLGKYLSALSVFGVALIISIIFPITLSIFASISFKEVLCSYIGIILLWGTAIAIGIFISSLTENQIVALIISMGFFLIVYLINTLATTFINNPVIINLVSWISIMERYDEIQTGILDSGSIIYYLSLTFSFLFLTVRVIDRRRY